MVDEAIHKNAGKQKYTTNKKNLSIDSKKQKKEYQSWGAYASCVGEQAHKTSLPLITKSQTEGNSPCVESSKKQMARSPNTDSPKSIKTSEKKKKHKSVERKEKEQKLK